MIGAGRAPTYVTLHTGGVGTTITHGSVEGPVGVPQPGLDTEAIFVIVPLVAVTFIGIVIFGKFVLAAIEAELVHTMEVVPVQVHPGAEIDPLIATPVGSTSVTVVIPLVEAGHSFFTLRIYSNTSPVLSITAPLIV